MKFPRNLLNAEISKIQLLSFLADAPIDLLPNEGSFSESAVGAIQMDDVYHTVGSIQLGEESKNTSAGIQYQITFGFSFPNNDKRVVFINRLKALKLIRIYYCDGKYVDIGRNDYHLNNPITGSFNTTKDFVSAEWIVNTIFPYQRQ